MVNMHLHFFKKKKDYKKPFKYNSWDDIPIDLYYKIRDIVLDEALKDIDKNIEIIALLKEVNINDITSLPIDDVTYLVKELKWINKFDFDKKKAIDKYDNNYVIYNLSDFTYAQFVDFQTYYQMGVDKFLPEIISTFLIPKGKKYNVDYDLDKQVNWIRTNVPITVAQNILFFFLLRCQNSLNLMLTCLKLMMKLKMIKKIPKNLEKNLMEQIKLLNSMVG